MTTAHRAPAKLTWSLRVVGVRDDGYHLIDAEMVTLDLADVVDVDAGAGDDARRCPARSPAACPTDASNLVARALAAVGRTAAVHIDKQIPSGGGLGGGSADAAAILRWAGVDDAGVGRRPRVPTCRSASPAGGPGSTGIGEVVEPLPHVERTVTLVVPPLHVSTPAGLPRVGRPGRPDAPTGRNDLEPAAIPSNRGWPSGATASRSCAGRSRRWPAAARRGSSRADATTPSAHWAARAERR